MLHQGCALLFDGQQFEHCGGPTDGARLALQFVTTRELKQSPATTGNSVTVRQTHDKALHRRRQLIDAHAAKVSSRRCCVRQVISDMFCVFTQILQFGLSTRT